MFFLDKGEYVVFWIENIKFGDFYRLFYFFCIKILEDFVRLFFIKDIFGEFKLVKFVEEIRYFVRNVVFYKYFKDEEKILGIVYVYEVIVKYIDN